MREHNDAVPNQHVPLRHLAITMDGNGRWAQSHGLPRTSGHRKGADIARQIINAVSETDIKALTLFGFSYENWQREPNEVHYLLNVLLPKILSDYSSEAMDRRIRVRVIGELEGMSSTTRKKIRDIEERTVVNDGLMVNFAISYSGRREIISSINRIIADIKNGRVSDNGIDEEVFEKYLYTCEMPDPDLHIRCGGVRRLSNFLLWQMAYTEQLYLDTLWPDFNEAELKKAIEYYARQPRKFGKVI